MSKLADETSAQPVGRSPAHLPRLTFLDALRGIAALSVALAHRAEGAFAGFAHVDQKFFRFGQFGVVVFFLCSGFIIPASLERYDSLKRFWIGRFFRLFPLYWVVLAAAFALAVVGAYRLDAGFDDAPGWPALLNATMVQALLGVPLVLGLSWTLGFELGFYALMSVLFALGLHRRSAALAVVAAALACCLGVLNSGSVVGALVLLAVLGSVAGAAAWRAGRPGRRVWLGLLLGVAVAALVGNRYGEAWLNVSFLAVMFAGTVLYRHFRGTASTAAAVSVYAGAGTAITATVYAQAAHRSWAITFGVAFAVFGLCYLLRARRFPRPLVLLGAVSYSLYLVHPLVYSLVPRLPAAPWWGLCLAVTAAVLLSAVTYRWVELPMIAVGHRVAGRRQHESR